MHVNVCKIVLDPMAKIIVLLHDIRQDTSYKYLSIRANWKFGVCRNIMFISNRATTESYTSTTSRFVNLTVKSHIFEQVMIDHNFYLATCANLRVCADVFQKMFLCLSRVIINTHLPLYQYNFKQCL